MRRKKIEMIEIGLTEEEVIFLNRLPGKSLSNKLEQYIHINVMGEKFIKSRTKDFDQVIQSKKEKIQELNDAIFRAKRELIKFL